MIETEISPEMFSVEEGFMTSPLMDVARRVLPEGVKKQAKRILRHAEYPLKEPYCVSIAGYDALFNVNNASDWSRLVAGDYEKDFAAEILQTIARKKGQFLDVGSAQGLYSLLAVAAGAEGVTAIDPDPLSCLSLRENIELNPQLGGRVKLIELALGSENATRQLYFDRTGTYAPSLKKTVGGLRQTKEVLVQTLDSLIDGGLIKSPDIIKIDVEGAEGNVIKGAKKLLESNKRPEHLFMEFHLGYIGRFGYNAVDLARQITSYGYGFAGEPTKRRTEVHCHFAARC